MQAGAPNFFALFFREGEEGGKINMDICMPSALTGFCFLMLERRIVRRAGEQDRKDGARRRKEIMMNVWAHSFWGSAARNMPVLVFIRLTIYN